METEETTSLDTLMTTLQRRWGSHALYTHPSVSTEEWSCIPTGFPELDAGLQTDGIPHSQITEILGQPTCGTTTLALKVIGNAQAQGDPAAYIDLGNTFDPVYAADCGVDLDRLLLVRPNSAIQALDIARDLVIDGSFGILVLDLVLAHVASLDRTPIRSMIPLLSRSNCALVLLAQVPVTSLTALRMQFWHQTWIDDHDDIHGFYSQVSVLKNKLSSAQPILDLEFTFERGEGEVTP